ncbi:unnamed protein product [Dracunculus medinensis]|uniref:Reverse transcriptase domain-containing protein n=1 Tax=Dracunculus medinensis TaxID=318479 RepID=A0A0N4URD1_DRAME|nr:unnamed protein product [Dracunculus medinensis]
MDKIPHDSIHFRSNITCINNVIIEGRLRWLGHILRRPPQELTHISLFAKLCEWIMDTACRYSRDVRISPEHRITDLEYADNVVLFADSYNEMQVILNSVSETAARIGLRINVNKTKAFSSYVQKVDKMPLFVNSLPVEEVPGFKYLGSTLIANGQAKDITTRITAARNAFFQLTKPLWSRREITIKTKVRIYIAVIRSILLYGSGQ